jgi:hypothetical protein
VGISRTDGLTSLQDKEVPPYVTILPIHGPFVFDTTDKLAEETEDLKKFGSLVIPLVRAGCVFRPVAKNGADAPAMRSA